MKFLVGTGKLLKAKARGWDKGSGEVWFKGRMVPTHPRPVLRVAGTSAPGHHIILRLVERGGRGEAATAPLSPGGGVPLAEPQAQVFQE